MPEAEAAEKAKEIAPDYLTSHAMGQLKPLPGAAAAAAPSAAPGAAAGTVGSSAPGAAGEGASADAAAAGAGGAGPAAPRTAEEIEAAAVARLEKMDMKGLNKVYGDMYGNKEKQFGPWLRQKLLEGWGVPPKRAKVLARELTPKRVPKTNHQPKRKPTGTLARSEAAAHLGQGGKRGKGGGKGAAK
eukprot:scaffold18.g1885.t1